MQPKSLFKLFTVLFLGFILVMIWQRMAVSPEFYGIAAYLPHLLGIVFIGLIIRYYRKIKAWIMLPVFLLCMQSCDYVASDKIGVWVENYGKSIDDYSLVMGKFPIDWFSKSSWSLQFPATNFPVHVEPIQMYCKDGVGVFVDPSVLCALIRSDEACKKFALQFSAYKDGKDFQEALAQTILKETVESCRQIVQNTVSDTLLSNRGHYYSIMEERLRKRIDDVYGTELKQFSVEISVDPTLQAAINARLLEQEKTKKTVAAMENTRAEIELMKLTKQKIDLESQAYSPQFLKKLELDYSYNAWIALANSPNKVFVQGSLNNFLLSQ